MMRRLRRGWLAGLVVAVFVCCVGAGLGSSPTSMAARPVVAAHAAKVRMVVMTISAQIDGRSTLTIRGHTAFWTHLTQAAPGRHFGGNLPTKIGSASWVPKWPHPGENRDCHCGSDVFRHVSPALPSNVPITFKAVSCREACSATTGNGLAVIRFDDEMMASDAQYVVTLSFPAQDIVLSGRVLLRTCSGDSGPGGHCQIADVPDGHQEVLVSGPGGSHRTQTKKDGSYSIVVHKRGHYTVSVVERDSRVKSDPVKRVVNARSDAPGLDFIRCPPVHNRARPNCNLVEVTGQTVDIYGSPFKLVTVSGDGGSAISDATGHFALWVVRGPQKLDAEGPSESAGAPVEKATPRGSVEIDAVNATRNVAITVHPAIDAPFAQNGGESIPIALAGLPLHRPLQLVIRPVGATPSGCESFAAHYFVPTARRTEDLTLTADHDQRFCVNQHHLRAELVSGEVPLPTAPILASTEFVAH